MGHGIQTIKVDNVTLNPLSLAEDTEETMDYRDGAIVLMQSRSSSRVTLKKQRSAVEVKPFGEESVSDLVVETEITELAGIVVQGGLNAAIGYESAVVHGSDFNELWTQVNDAPDVGQRAGSATAVFNDKMWVMGGFTLSGVENDFWVSDDGVNFTEVEPTLSHSLGNRSYAKAVVHNDKLYLCGGFLGTGFIREVWESNGDGTSFTRVATSLPFTPNTSSTLLSDGTKMWWIGVKPSVVPTSIPAGTECIAVYSSTDGVTWSQETADWGLDGKACSGGCMYNGEFYLVGGFDTDATNSVYKSSDGVSWSSLTQTAAFPARSFSGANAAIAIHNAIYVLPGYDDGAVMSVYKSMDGESWSEVVSDWGFPAMNSYNAVEFSVSPTPTVYVGSPSALMYGNDFGELEITASVGVESLVEQQSCLVAGSWESQHGVATDGTDLFLGVVNLGIDANGDALGRWLYTQGEDALDLDQLLRVVTPASSQMDGPQKPWYHAPTQTMYVVDRSNHRVWRTTYGDPLWTIDGAYGSFGTAEGELFNPSMAVRIDNEVFVIQNGGGGLDAWLTVFNATTGVFIRRVDMQTYSADSTWNQGFVAMDVATIDSVEYLVLQNQNMDSPDPGLGSIVLVNPTTLAVVKHIAGNTENYQWADPVMVKHIGDEFHVAHRTRGVISVVPEDGDIDTEPIREYGSGQLSLAVGLDSFGTKVVVHDMGTDQVKLFERALTSEPEAVVLLAGF